MQIKLDSMPMHLALNFPQNSQQIYWHGMVNHKNGNLIQEILVENGYSESPTAENVLNEVKAVISKWSGGRARLVVTGSYLLGTYTANSDIDAICAVPLQRWAELMRAKDDWHGERYTHCDLGLPLLKRKCEDGSLYCHFCQHSKVEQLIKIPRAYIPLLEIKIAGIDIDLSFAAIPKVNTLADEPLEAADVELMMELLTTLREPPEAMLRSLSSYLANSRTMDLLKEKNMGKFRNLLLTLKLWAKANHIYGSIYGFLNGISLSIMATKITLFYPNASLPFLFEKFLIIFSSWNWPMPVQLIETPTGVFDPFSWNPNSSKDSKDSKMANVEHFELDVMPIITPSSLTQNATYNVNASTQKIILNEMFQTLEHIRKLQNFGNNSSDTNEWRRLFPVKQFTEMYHHFVVITCMISTVANIEQFCGFVERRIRLQLMQFDRALAPFIEYSHVKPDRAQQQANGNKCPHKLEIAEFANSSVCKMWLVGLKMRDEKLSAERIIQREQMIIENLEKEIDAKILKEYEEKVLRGWYQRNNLVSTYVKSTSELAEWFSDGKDE